MKKQEQELNEQLYKIAQETDFHHFEAVRNFQHKIAQKFKKNFSGKRETNFSN